MKFLNKNIFLILTLSLFFYNCSNDDDMNGDTTPLTENLRLSNYSRGSIEYSVSYNENGKITNYSNDPSYSGNIIYNADDEVIQCGISSYTYNAQGRISKITEPDSPSARDKETTIIYNNDGLIAQQTLRFYSIARGGNTFVTRDFDYNSNNQLVSVTEQESGDTYSTRELLTYDTNDNVVQVKRQTSLDGTNFTDDQINNFTYDNNKNPSKQMLDNIERTTNFSSIYLNYLTTMYYGNYAYFRLFYYSNNNITSVQRIYSSGTSNATYNYVYNDEDLPVSVEIHNELSDGTNYISYRTWTYETY